jgi:hypothetical protein
MDDFWFNHFNVFLDKGADRYLLTEYERDTIRFKVTTVAPVGVGAPNYVSCAFVGYYWPARLPRMGKPEVY